MEHVQLVVLFLLVAVAALTTLARVLGLPYPILLVVGGSLVGYQRMVREVLDAQRRRVIELRDDGTISGDVLHVLERELDLEDQRLEI
jgi:hypothetical protein